MQRKMEQNTPQLVQAPRPAHGCPVCWERQKPSGHYARGWITSLPVYVVDGKKQTLRCYAAKCIECGYIAHYGLQQGVYKLSGTQPDFAMGLWPEISHHRISPAKLLAKVLRSEKGPVYVQLNEVQHDRETNL